ncbi:MAG TPA: hypothetical protein VKA68_05360 [bacterium]|nr:hypothetical protein [bacterium]
MSNVEVARHTLPGAGVRGLLRFAIRHSIFIIFCEVSPRYPAENVFCFGTSVICLRGKFPGVGGTITTTKKGWLSRTTLFYTSDQN